MKKLYPLLILLFLFNRLKSQVNVSGSVSKNYTSLKSAFDDINNGAITGQIQIIITGSTTENASAVLNAPGVSGSNYTAINMICTSSATISGTNSNALIIFNGSKNILLNGQKLLTITNKANNGNAISFINDVTNLVVKDCLIMGANTSGGGGVIFFGSGPLSGNSKIKIDSCDIDCMSSATYGINSSGNTVSAAMENNSDSVMHCNIFNFRQSSANTAAIFLNYGSTNWFIQKNNIYQTQNVISGVKGIMYGIWALPFLPSDTHIVTENAIGGNAVGAIGNLSFTASGSNAIGFIGMDIETAGPGNSITNNTVKNINVNYNNPTECFQNSGIFCYVSSFTGSSAITGNNISDVNMTNASGLIAFQGISCTVQASQQDMIIDSFFINNNNIANITGNSGGNGDVQLYGIRLNNNGQMGTSSSTLKVFYSITGNTLSDFNAPFAGTFTYIRGISNLNNVDSFHYVTIVPTYAVVKNTLHGFNTLSKLGSYTSAAIEGIKLSGGSVTTEAFTENSIVGNTIYDLNCNQTGNYSTTAIGIYTSNGSYTIERNKIYAIKNLAVAQNTYPLIVGIHSRSSLKSTTIKNNFVSLGSESANDLGIFCILNSSTTDSINIYFNTLVIGGNGNPSNKLTTAPVGKASLGSELVATPLIVKNNILINKRTFGNANFAVFVTEPTGWSADHNDLFSMTAGSDAFYNDTKYDFHSYVSKSKQDQNSINENVTFIDSLSGDLHLYLPSRDLKSGIHINDILTDFDFKTRDAATPFIGAQEYSGLLSAGNNKTLLFKIFPNPAHDKVFLQIESLNTGKATLSVSNLISQKVIYQSITVTGNGITLPLDISYLEKGIYFIRLEVNGDVNTLKLIKL